MSVSLVPWSRLCHAWAKQCRPCLLCSRRPWLSRIVQPPAVVLPGLRIFWMVCVGGVCACACVCWCRLAAETAESNKASPGSTSPSCSPAAISARATRNMHRVYHPNVFRHVTTVGCVKMLSVERQALAMSFLGIGAAYTGARASGLRNGLPQPLGLGLP